MVHFKELSGEARKGFLRAFPRRFRRIAPHLGHARLFTNPEEVYRFLSSLHCVDCTTYCDDTLYRWLRKRGLYVIPESRVPRGLRPLMLLADNLANYYRVMRERGKTENVEELMK